jgi:L-ascorbate metabolism protein UlaG (beta-lactamase superfamily)
LTVSKEENMRVLLGLAVAVAMTAAATAEDTIPATGGNIEITPITHGSVQVEYAGTVIQVDPYSKGDLSKAKQADVVLVTDIHSDHMDPGAIAKVRKAGAPVVMPAAVQKEGGDKIPTPHVVLGNGETKTVEGVVIETVPMYNVKPNPETGEVRHTKGRGNGYIVTLGSKRVYFAGDTGCTPEMKALKNIDAAFLPMNPPNTMSTAEAAECVKAFLPKVAYPYHHRGQNPEEFAAALKGAPVEVRILTWYPE